MEADELQRIVRDVIDRRLSGSRPGGALSDVAAPSHASLWRLRLPSGDAAGGACFIEPVVACTHCGYCQSYGH